VQPSPVAVSDPTPPEAAPAGRSRGLARRIDKLGSILDVAKAMTVERDLDRLLDMILAEAAWVVEAERCSLFLLDEDTGELWSKIAQGLESREIRFPVGQGVAGSVAATGEPVIIDDAYQDVRFNREVDRLTGYRTRNILCVPMLRRGGNGRGHEVAGVIQALNRRQGAFTEEDRELLMVLGGQAAAAIESARLHNEIEELFDGFIKASVIAIESRDPTTSGHSERVATLSVELAEMVTRDDAGPYRDVVFDRDELRELRYGALLHDFGKVGVREHVLLKAKKLLPYDLERVRARFEFARRTVETDVLRRKLALLGRGASPDEVAATDAWGTEQCSQIEHFWDVVVRCNEPSLFGDDPAPELHRVAAATFRGANGEPHPLLTRDELHALNIPRGTLSDEERREVESHVEHTWRFLKVIPWTRTLRRVPLIAYAHHEKLTGDGYPRRLRATEIPVQARILTICDIYDALTASDRPYKRAVPHEQALAVLGAECDEGKLDRHLLRVFIEANVPAVLRTTRITSV
jgi:HD-GYP domain-containing protein (c-di-GMP phosphodiesterase class II)